jgi:hypothetical protein
MYGIGQSGNWNQLEIGFWKSFFHFLISFFNLPFWRASNTIGVAYFHTFGQLPIGLYNPHAGREV